MNFPDDVRFSITQPDGSALLEFDDKTAWIASPCDTCQKVSIMEIMRTDGVITGIRFMATEKDIVPPGLIEALNAGRQKQKQDFFDTWREVPS